MTIMKLKSTESALVANDSHATTVSDSTLVRVYNSNSSTAYTVTLQTASANSSVNTGAVVVGTLTIAPNQEALLRKDSTDEVWAASTEVLATAISYEG